MDERSRQFFNKSESELNDYERMMLEVMAARADTEETRAEESPVEEHPAEETPVEDAPVEETPVEDAPVEEHPVEETPVEEAPVEETPVEEAPSEEAPVEVTPAAAESDDSDVKIVAEPQPEKPSQPIPLLVEEKNPELEPVVVNRPTIQFMNSIEREKKITRKMRQRRLRSGVVVLGLCVALILVAFLYNGFVNKSWGFLEKPEPTPEPTPEPPPPHRYEIVRANVSWVGAQDQCLSKGGYLAVINSREEFDRITALADEQGIEFLWIGSHRDVNSNTLVWERDEPVDPSVDLSNNRMALWARGEPSYIDGDGSNEDYIGLWNHDGGWSYWDCRNDLHNLWWGLNRIAFVCEYDN